MKGGTRIKNKKTHLGLIENRNGNTSKSDSLELGDGDVLVPVLDVLGDAESAEDAFARLHAWNQSRGAMNAGAYDVEQELFRGGMEVLRRMLEENFRCRGVGDVGSAIVLEAEEDKEAIRLGHRRLRGRNYESIFGTIRLERLGYNARGEESVHPLDEVLNLPERKYS